MKLSWKKYLVFALPLFLLMLCVSCNEITPTSDIQAAKETERMMQQANKEVGVAKVTKFTEKRQANTLYELRDRADLKTFTYIKDLNGDLHFLCKSMGYGIPYSAQSTNPEKVVKDNYHTYGTLPQPEPNGLFMPDGLSATWVMCLDPNSGKVSPSYIEPEILVTRFKLNAKTSYVPKTRPNASTTE